jgi:hypothetical protein
MPITFAFDEFPEDYEPSDELADLFQSAFDGAMNSLDDSDSLAPLLVELASDGQTHVTEFTELNEEDALEAVSDRLHSASEIMSYTVAYLAELSIEGESYDIVVVEGAERAMDHAYRVVQILDGEDNRVIYHGRAVQRFA